ncbi:MAG: acyl carrier protein [Candidatus Pacearchaeota archaeon]
MKSEIINIIKEILYLGKKKIDETTVLDEIIVNSMDVIELIAVLSNKYKIKVDPKEMNNIKTVGNLINYIEKNKGNKTSVKLDNTF